MSDWSFDKIDLGTVEDGGGRALHSILATIR